MNSSSSIPAAAIDPYVLEFAVNLKWLLRYASQNLDPTVEVHYPTFMADVVAMESILSRARFDESCTLNDLPYGALRLSREAVLYLLVCDHLLGGCPPTMHPFLQRAYGHKRAINKTDGDSERRSLTPSASPASTRATPSPPAAAKRAGLNTDLNTSFPSDNEDSGADGRGRRVEAGVGLPGQSFSTKTLDEKPVGMLDSANERAASFAAAGAGEEREAQAALLLLRWLFVEGVLAEDELAATLNLDFDSTSSWNSGVRTGIPSEELRIFRRHQRLAQRLSELIPFYLGAHVLISRSLLLQYSATLLTADGVMQHVRRLEAPLTASSSNYTPYSALRPPSSVEGALLEWFQAIMDSARRQLRDPSPSTTTLQRCPTLCGFIEHGPFCNDVLDPSERDFFRLVQSGECVCVALWFYCPDALAVAELARALRDADDYIATQPAEAAMYDAAATADLVLRHQSLCYWTAAFAAARYLGVVPLLSPAEVVAFGRTALPLHLFVFVQQLFAVLATTAEEEVRVSADTAWWEQMGNSDKYTDVMEAREAEAAAAQHGRSGTPEGPSVRNSRSTVPGAQQVLRESMRDSFPPEAFQHAVEKDFAVQLDKAEKQADDVEPRKSSVDEVTRAQPQPASAEAIPSRSVPSELPDSETHLKSGQNVALPTTAETPARVTRLAAPTSAVVSTSNAYSTRDLTPLTKESLSTNDFVNLYDEERKAALLLRGGQEINAATDKRSGSTSLATSTHFTVEFAHTQRGRGDPSSNSHKGGCDGEDGDATRDPLSSVASSASLRLGGVETASSVLRPMVRRRSAGGSHANPSLASGTGGAASSYSNTDFTSVDTLHKVSAQDVDTGKVMFAAQAVDTYARTPEEVPLSQYEIAKAAPAAVRSTPNGTRQPALAKPLGKTSGTTSRRASASSRDGLSRNAGVATSDGQGKPPLTPLPLTTDALFTVISPAAAPGQDAEQPSSPQLPGARKAAVKKQSPAFDATLPTSPLHLLAKAKASPSSSSSMSSDTYTSDFVVQSGPQDTLHSSHDAKPTTGENSASFAPHVAPTTQMERATVVNASPLLPSDEQSDMDDVQPLPPPPSNQRKQTPPPPSTENKVPASVSSSTVAIKTFHAAKQDVDSNESSSSSSSSSRSSRGHPTNLHGSDNDSTDIPASNQPVKAVRKTRVGEKQVSTASNASSSASSFSIKHPLLEERAQERQSSSTSSSSEKAKAPVQALEAVSSLHPSARQSGVPLSLQSLSTTPTHPLAAATAPTPHPSPTPRTLPSNDSSRLHPSRPHSATRATEVPPSPTVTDIAVEDDGTSTASHDADGATILRESFPTPTEREEANRRRAATAWTQGAVQSHDDTSADVSSPSMPQTPERGVMGGSVAQSPARLPGVFSPSPIQPDREDASNALLHLPRRRRNADPLHGSVASQHTLSDTDDNNRHLDGLSPLTPALTQSISEVYGTDYASLLEDAAHSYGSLPGPRRSRQWDEESWFSSASHPHRQSLQSTAESIAMSNTSLRDAAPVRELLRQLGSVALTDVEHRNAAELRAALAQQQELVRQLATALQERTHGRGTTKKGFTPSAVSAGGGGIGAGDALTTTRTSERPRQVRLRSPSEEFGSSRESEAKRRSQLTVAKRRGRSATPAERRRQRSVSAMTVESRASPSQSTQTDVHAQLAETDVSSMLADILMPGNSVSPPRASLS